MLEQAAAVLKDLPTKQVRVLMPASSRLDLLVAGMHKMKSLFGEESHYSV